MKECFDIKFTFTNIIVIADLLIIAGAIFGAISGSYEIMYGGLALLGTGKGFNTYGKKNEK